MSRSPKTPFGRRKAATGGGQLYGYRPEIVKREEEVRNTVTGQLIQIRTVEYEVSNGGKVYRKKPGTETLERVRDPAKLKPILAQAHEQLKAKQREREERERQRAELEKAAHPIEVITDPSVIQAVASNSEKLRRMGTLDTVNDK
jgi:hypothetical protein